MAYGKISLAHTIHCCPIFFISFGRPATPYCEEYVCIYTYLTVLTLYINYHCYQIVLQMKHFYTTQVWSEVLTGYLSLGRQTGGQWEKL